MINAIKFIQTLEFLKKINNDIKSRSEALNTAFPNSSISYDDLGLIDLNLETLAEFFPKCKWPEDMYYTDDIECFWYEAYSQDKPMVATTKDGDEITITTPGELYDMLIKQENEDGTVHN